MKSVMTYVAISALSLFLSSEAVAASRMAPSGQPSRPTLPSPQCSGLRIRRDNLIKVAEARPLPIRRVMRHRRPAPRSILRVKQERSTRGNSHRIHATARAFRNTMWPALISAKCV